jgi:membrane-associated phospholipid phosphatase
VSTETNSQDPKETKGSKQATRRGFLKGAASAAATAGAMAAGIGLEPLLGSGKSQALAQTTTTTTTSTSSNNPPSNTPTAFGQQNPQQRAQTSLEIRTNAAQAEFNLPQPQQLNNQDEVNFPNFVGNFTKALPHDQFGVVVPSAYQSLLTALTSGNPTDFENITLGGTMKIGDPQSGLAFDLEGTDSHKLAEAPAFSVASADRADEMIELYWAALARDVPFANYGNEPITQAAIADLNKVANFHGPKINGKVTPQTLFRGPLAGELVGPLVSQFFVMPAPFGALAVNDSSGNPTQMYNVNQPGIDYMKDVTSFLNVQSGINAIPGPFNLAYGPTQTLGPRLLRDGRGLASFVHVDELYQAYFMATLNLLDRLQTPFNPGNPYNNSKTQFGFGTFGAPHAVTLLAEVSTRALHAQWYQKWFVHRTLRPEAFGGLVNFKVNNKENFPVHADVLNSSALQAILNNNNGTALLPMAFPEGCPPFPALGSGHSTVAGACATFIKAFFDENFVIPNPVVPSADGTQLLPYKGSDAGQITILTEAHKIASNVGMGRVHAGVHWRSDHTEALFLGEAVAISILRDQRATYNENFQGFTFTKFDGTKITV